VGTLQVYFIFYSLTIQKRAKIRFVLEKLENSLTRVNEVIKQAGNTTKPLLGQTIPGKRFR
jgi:hypothetical protein